MANIGKVLGGKDEKAVAVGGSGALLRNWAAGPGCQRGSLCRHRGGRALRQLDENGSGRIASWGWQDHDGH